MTLIVAAQCSDGVVISADSKLSIGNQSSLPAGKIFPINHHAKIWGASYSDGPAFIAFKEALNRFPEKDEYIFSNSLHDSKSGLCCETTNCLNKISLSVKSKKEIQLIFCQVHQRMPYVHPPYRIIKNQVSPHPYNSVGQVSGLYQIGHQPAFDIVTGIFNDNKIQITTSSRDIVTPIIYKSLWFAIVNYPDALAEPINIYQIDLDGIISPISSQQMEQWRSLVCPPSRLVSFYKTKFSSKMNDFSKQIKFNSLPRTRRFEANPPIKNIKAKSKRTRLKQKKSKGIKK
jgi:hypothetical protein